MSNHTIYFSCSCGETYEDLRHAIDCYKCVRYLRSYNDRTVIASQENFTYRVVWAADADDEANQKSYQDAMNLYRG